MNKEKLINDILHNINPIPCEHAVYMLNEPKVPYLVCNKSIIYKDNGSTFIMKNCKYKIKTNCKDYLPNENN